MTEPIAHVTASIEPYQWPQGITKGAQLDFFKGGDLNLSGEALRFVAAAIATVLDIHRVDPNDPFPNPQNTLVTLVKRAGWCAVQDGHGDKAYVAMPYKDPNPAFAGATELRVTVVLPRRQAGLRLDIRPWGIHQAPRRHGRGYGEYR